MSTHDAEGREWAKLSELTVGDEVVTDGNFTCVDNSVPHVVMVGAGGLCIQCSDGNHYLDGQLGEDGDHLVGLYKVLP